MARPAKEGADYFTHDTDACSDEKIEAMRALYGNDGYAFYFILLERIYKTSIGGFDVSKPAIYAMLVKKVGVDKEKFEEMLNTAFDLELFSKKAFEEKKIITSNGIQKRFNKIVELRENWKKKKENSEKKEVFSRENLIDNDKFSPEKTPQKTPESKVKEIKENKRENKSTSTPPVPPNGQLVIEFEEDWQPYPNKECKKDAFFGYSKARKKYPRERIQLARDNYILVLQNETFDRKPMNGGRFFKKEYENYFEIPGKIEIKRVQPSKKEVTPIDYSDDEIIGKAKLPWNE